MSPKPNLRSWNDVQMSIAAVSIVATLGLWNLFAEPAKPLAAPEEPVLPPTEPPVASLPNPVPQIKIMFTQLAPQTTTVQQAVNNQQQKKKKKDKNNNDTGGSVTQTKSS
jgi:hypothetical protein